MAAEIRAAAGARGSFMMPASVRTVVAVCDRANLPKADMTQRNSDVGYCDLT